MTRSPLTRPPRSLGQVVVDCAQSLNSKENRIRVTNDTVLVSNGSTSDYFTEAPVSFPNGGDFGMQMHQNPC